jgi:hypothetical protein
VQQELCRGIVLSFFKDQIWLKIRPAWRPFILPIWSVLVLLLALQLGSVQPAPAAAPSAPNEAADRTALKAKVSDLLDRAAFQELDALAQDWRQNRAETASGVRKLTLFYAAIHDKVARLSREDSKSWDAILTELAQWQALAPASPAPVIATTIVLKRRAWSERPRVTLIEIADGYDARFLARLQMTREYLDRHASVAAVDPHYFVVLAEMAAAQNEDVERIVSIVDRGLALDPGYHKVAMAGLDYFAPAARGSAIERRQMQAFANGVTARVPDADAFYARLYWHATASGYGRSVDFDWRTVVRGMDAILARNDVPWNRENLAKLACEAGDLATARRLLALQNAPAPDAIWASATQRTACRQG